ncbi:MAG: DUF2100 domain-containing protein [Promethearchaeota archaeon]
MVIKIKSEEVKSILAAIDDLIEIKILIRKITPDYNLNDTLNKFFIEKLVDLHKNLQPLLSKYLKEEFILKTKKSINQLKEDIQDIIKNGNFALVSANSSKKKLKTIGFDPRLLIVTGGPLFFEDYNKINQNISDNAIISIKKKCERILTQIETINWNHKDLIFIYDSNNTTDKLILKRIDALSKLIGKKVKTLEITSWNVLDKF